ncbi:MAG TPA: hypothetical protein VGM77_11215 [Gemmatimonadales bacterium]|jgi:hypothetical protein
MPRLSAYQIAKRDTKKPDVGYGFIVALPITYGLTHLTGLSFDAMGKAVELAGELLASLAAAPILAFSWNWMLGSFRADDEERAELEYKADTAVARLAEREKLITSLTDVGPKIQALDECLIIGKRLLLKECASQAESAEWIAKTEIDFDGCLNNKVWPLLDVAEQQTLRYVTYYGTPEVPIFDGDQHSRWCRTKAMVNGLDVILAKAHDYKKMMELPMIRS